MKFCWLFGCIFLITQTHAQFRRMGISPSFYSSSASASDYLNPNKKLPIRGLSSDPQTYSRYSSPWLTFAPSTGGGQSFWLGSTTTQSFNHGKFGTIYYYDMLGNMQSSRTFIDIAGKNKRGLKLLLPTLNQRMFMQR